MRRLLLAVLGSVLGAACVVAGVFVLFGVGWALIVGGGAVAAVSVLLVDVEERDGESSPASP